MGDYSVGIVGESFANGDGSSRQREIGRCSVGESVTLEREPDNPHDAKCVRVISVRGVQIGNISREHPWICERLDRGAAVAATIEYIGRSERGLLGVVIDVRTDKEPSAGPKRQEAPPPPAGQSLAKAGQSMTEAGCAIVKGCLALAVLIFIGFVVVAIIRG